MLLALNLGNSRISVGFFEKDKREPIAKFKISTDINKTSDEYGALIGAIIDRCDTIREKEISGCVVSSVVPQLTATVLETLKNFTDDKPIVVGPGVKTGFPIKIDSPSELGADIVANTAALIGTQKENGKTGAAVIVDMGTVTTVSAISKNGEYLGCSIFPGVGISFDALHGKTAQLPNVMPEQPTRAIGKNSRDSLRSGVIIGNSMIIDSMAEKFAEEMKCDIRKLDLVLTGEFASAMIGVCKHDFRYEEDMTLIGLRYIYYNNLLTEQKN